MASNESYEHSYYKTFSGADSLAFMLLPDCKPILLGSLTTFSYSMYRDKKPVTLVGKVNVSGYTRGMRVIAGTMIFTLINQHLSKDLVEQVPYLSKHGKIKADELPLFDIMVISANEYGASTKMMVYGIDITDDAQVLSIQDLFTENTFNFVARDLDEFTAQKTTVVKGNRRGYNVVDTVMPYGINLDTYENMRKLMASNVNNEDLIRAQSELVRKGDLYKVSGVYDNDTLEAVKRVQARSSINQTGMLDRTTYDIITSLDGDDREVVTVSSTKGAFVYQDKDMTRVNGIAKQMDSFLSKKDGDFYKVTFYGSEGYIHKSDIDKSFKFNVNFLTEPGVVNVNNADYSNIGLEITPQADMDIKVSAVCYYGKEKDAHSRYTVAKQNTKKTISLSELSDAYIYNLAYKSVPDRVVFIILSQGMFIHKWDVRIGEGA